eukprot:1151539-Pelagomonas_calceolata.AAC.2
MRELCRMSSMGWWRRASLKVKGWSRSSYLGGFFDMRELCRMSSMGWWRKALSKRGINACAIQSVFCVLLGKNKGYAAIKLYHKQARKCVLLCTCIVLHSYGRMNKQHLT